MRTLVHLSDLHFGRVDPDLLAPLARQVHALAPQVVVVSGDLTQRARHAEFAAARAWLDRLPAPQIIVPGNHDIALYNLYRRFVTPLKRFRRHITPDLAPFYADAEIAVAGLNTARSLTVKDGRVNRMQLEHLRARFDGLAPDVVRVVVTHHPFELPPGTADDLVGRAGVAMRAFADCGVDILLSGHLHASDAGSTAARYPIDDFAAVVVQAGTATSTRGRGEVNSFNVLRIDTDRVEVERYGWDQLGAAFALLHTQTFLRRASVWSAHSEGVLAAGL
jgi:3',5'-cyclic AMP phosphodiesterase CpdA